MRNYLRKLFEQKNQPESEVKKELREFLEYLQLEIDDTVEDSLSHKLRLFAREEFEHQIENLAGLYLLFEQSRLSSERGEWKEKSAIRKEIKSWYPVLADTKFLKLVFLNKREQERELAQLLIWPIEKKTLEIVGDNQKELFKNFNFQVAKAFEQFDFDQLSRNELQSTIKYEFSNLIESLIRILGRQKVHAWTQSSYDKLANNYKFLETFPFLVALLPEDLLNEQQLSLLSRAHIENVLIEKTEKLEEINTLLRTEIEEKEKAQQALDDQANRLNNIIESALDAVVLMDEKGIVTFWNKQAEAIFGWTEKEVLGKRLSDFIVPEEEVSAHEEGLKHHLKTGQQKILNQRIEKVGKTKDGKRIELELSIVSNSIEDSTVFTGFIRDISSRKKYERDLMDAKEKAERASRTKAEFLSTMSHEIRTPMNGLFGTIELLLSEHPRQDQVESLKLMKHSTDNLLVILNDILDFSKIEEGHVEFDNRQFSIHELCSRIISTYKQKAEEKGIKLFLKSDYDESATYLGDPVRLSQILNNLISNAIKFTYAGEVELQAELISDRKTSSTYRFSVIDTGVGIANGDLARIFDRFTQLKNQRASDIQTGTGLGLAIAKKLLQLQQSDLFVESEIGQGSKFYFDIKLFKSHDAESKKKNTPQEDRDLSGLKILLVEDNKINQIVANKFLKKWNCDVDFAWNGLEAIEKVESKVYDIVLMDLQMPIMDGYEACASIRNRRGDYFKDVPIIALTADVLPEVKTKVMESGMNDFMPKPFDPDKLFYTITSHLKFFKVSR